MARTIRGFWRRLYESGSEGANRFRYGLLAFDMVTIVFIIATSFFERQPWIEHVDLAIGLVILVEFLLRLWISRRPLREIIHPYGLADIAVIVSLLAPVFGEGFAFLRALRLLRLARSYHLLKDLREDVAFFERNEASILAGLNLAVFVFVATAFVYETQRAVNPGIRHYADALYFTVTTLTTTGFGDITLQGTYGRLTAVVMMICGVSLFLRLIQVTIRPPKVHHRCPDCGLTRHDFDAVHCKACGRVLAIEDEGHV